MKNKKVRIILISIVVLILAGVLIYDQFFTYQIKRINADHVSKIVYILDPNVPSSKMMKKEITDKQDIKDFLNIYQNICFYKDILKGRSVGLNCNVIVYDTNKNDILWFFSAGDYIDMESGIFRNNLSQDENNQNDKKAKTIANKYKDEPYLS